MFSGHRRRQRAILAALAVVGILVGAYSYNNIGLLDSSLQAVTYDTFIMNAPARVSNQVTIIAIVDSTITRYRRYPLPRQAFVDLLNAPKPMAPRTVSFDVGFYDDSPNPDQDRALVLAIKDAGNVILALQGAGSNVGVPGAVRNVIGVLQVPNKGTGPFERRDQMLLERIAESVGPVLAQTSSELS